MPVRLLDVNVLLALLWDSHPQHAAAKGWFLTQRGDGWATTPITQLGFVRISATPKVLPAPTTVRVAAAVLQRATNAADHQFWIDDLDIAATLAALPQMVGHKQLTDAHLIALTRRHGGRLATFDRPLHGTADVEPVW